METLCRYLCRKMGKFSLTDTQTCHGSTTSKLQILLNIFAFYNLICMLIYQKKDSRAHDIRGYMPWVTQHQCTVPSFATHGRVHVSSDDDALLHGSQQITSLMSLLLYFGILDKVLPPLRLAWC